MFEDMKIGVKTYDDVNFLRQFKDKADFFEVMAIQDVDYSFLKEFSLPIIIHAQHEGFGVNNADKTRTTKNKESINFAINLANNYKSGKIIVHPGPITDENCSEEQAIGFFNSVNDKRILVENLPKNRNYICSTPEETKKFMIKINAGFCFDINHAIQTAIYLNQDYLKIIKEFIKLRPKHYHLGGQSLKDNADHLSFVDSDIPLKEIMKLIPRNAEITLETEPDSKKIEEDIKIMRELIRR